jgi:phospholipase C
MSWSGQSWGTQQPRYVADLTGDGTADIVGFGLDGVWTSLNNGDGTFQPPNMAPIGFCLHRGWTAEKHVRLLADLTGDGKSDIVGFGDNGVWTAMGNGDGTFQPPKFVVEDLGYDKGWRVDRHPRFAADITGDGKADLVGFGDAGVWVALGNGDGTFQSAQFVLADLGYNNGWRVGQHPRYVADVTGDGKADLVGFFDDGVHVALGNGDGSFQPPAPVFTEFDPAKGWQGTKHLRILGDLNGDHRADIIGFGDPGVYSALANSDGTFAEPTFILADLGYDKGWRLENHPRFATDLTGDGKADLVGFGDDGVWTSVTGGNGAHPVLPGFCYNQGWRVPFHPRYLADLTGDGKADIIGFGDAGVWVALGNGDGTFQAASFKLADFGYHAGPVVQSITIDFHTYDDNLNDDTLLHVFVKNRASDSSDSDGPTSYVANIQDYQDHDADWFSKNPYLGCAVNANTQGFDNDSTHRVEIQLRSKPIPLAELLLPAVHVHILPAHYDTWKFDYTLTITLDDGTMLPPYSSNVNGLTGIILDQDNRNYYGICSEVWPAPPRITVPDTDSVLTGVTIEFHTHNDNKERGTKLDIHIVNRLSATASQDIAVANDVAPSQEFPDSDGSYVRIDLTPAPQSIFLRDMVLPVVFINIEANGDTWIFDYRVTLFFGAEQPYSWSVSGVVLDQNHHKHMGVYNGRAFPTVHCPHPSLTTRSLPRSKDISLAFIGRMLQELFNSRQTAGSPDPVIKLRLDHAIDFGGQLAPSFTDLQFIANDPPPPDGPIPASPLGTAYSHGISDLGQLGWKGYGVRLNDINSQSLTLTVNPDDGQTPLTLDLQFETDGPVEVTGTTSADVIAFEVKIRLTLGFRHPDPGNAFSPRNAIDLMSWMDEISDASDDLFTQMVDVTFTTADKTDFGDTIKGFIQGKIFDKLRDLDPVTKMTVRDSLNATVSSWLMGGVIVNGDADLLPSPSQSPDPSQSPSQNPCTLAGVSVSGDVLSLSYFGPAKSFAYQAPPDWPTALPPGTLANIDHIVVLTQENRSFDHLLGYLSLPFEKGGMNRADVDGLKGGEFNLFNGRKIQSFRLAAGDTIFSPGPPNDPGHVADQVNGGRMDGFVLAQADEFGPEAAHRVMGYHTADNVPTYDSLARDFAICHRWFAPHPGPTFPNRFYQLTGRPNIDPWGAWEYANPSTYRPVLTETIFDHLTDRGVPWAYFEHYYCFLRFFERHTFDSQNVVSFDDPEKGFLALAKSGNLPSVSFIDPHFVDYPPGSFCDEPPSDLRNSQPFIRNLVEALVASPKWEKTLLIITYDEHGGFYDHVPPVPAARVSPEMLPTTGLRVPSFVISPWVKGSTVFGSDTLHFDHTSILKTIARRFMSSNPPFIGARYAAAHDLSEVLDDQLRPERFRPFIPYTLMCDSSTMRLDVQYASTAIGTPLWQYSPNETEAQKFRFEDAGNGFVYIRTLAGLYVSVDAPSGIPAGPGATLGIKQDLKYEPGSPGSRNPDLQRWNFTSSATVADAADYAISCAAVPGKVLQPLDGSTASGTAVALADPAPHRPTAVPNPWTVTSPLLSATPVING